MIRTLVEMRLKLWWRRSSKASVFVGAVGVLVGGTFSGIFSWAMWSFSGVLLERPQQLAERGGPLVVFETWMAMALVARVWISLISLAQPSNLFDLRRFRIYPVSPRLLSLVNFATLFVEPAWLVFYPLFIVIAAGVSRLPGAPGFLPLLFAEVLTVFAAGGFLLLCATVGAAFDSRPYLRRAFSVVLLMGGFAGFQLSTGSPAGQQRLARLFAGHRSPWTEWTPPGWAAKLAQALSERRFAAALGVTVALLLLGALCAVVSHALALRDAARPAEQVQASASNAHAAGWSLPLVPGTFSALFEKEAKTALRMGWLQLVLVPVAYLLLVRTMFSGPQPLLVAAVYANMGVLELSTNAFGRDTTGARAYFLWPLSLRELLAAKNAVSYCFSLAIFGLLSAVAAVSGRVTLGQVAIGVLAHAAIFPLLAVIGNALSVLVPSPVRGARLQRVRGAGPVGARLAALGLLAAAAWAPYAISRATGLRLGAAYLGELIAMAAAYAGTLTAGARFLETRRDPLLAALAKTD
ncbi:MAG TPA: hypothetical protein VH083_16875 [Myxococcales bacterium]|nr:hypothetical protein [Myxococcales bacterium]